MNNFQIGAANEEFPPKVFNMDGVSYNVLGKSMKDNLIPKQLDATLNVAAINNKLGQFIVSDNAVRVHEAFIYETSSGVFLGAIRQIK